ncbi:DMT family transporter [Sulfuriroseicoccus oceanibius]|uniref:DMT family transporter n=1 Tax=Sulfuriroseicoccus oceanibius TaxID=2707525 RepID=A0A6B3LCC8_9BACT|nr:DMT family transporter [Sulfuriroseicoccus oceanibius]QQL45942.1 DMT family transporter [Sulfuriroseicoccus oceanibius]
MEANRVDHLLLHFFVIVVGLTAILGKLIELPADQLVAWRTLAAAVVMGLVFYRVRFFRQPRKVILSYLGAGGVLGLHWLALYGAIKVSNVTVAVAGLSSAALFTALVEPVITGRRHSKLEVAIGGVVMIGLGLIVGFASEFGLGLVLGVTSALLAAIFPSMNKRFVDQGGNPLVITFHEMVGAFVVCAAVVLGRGEPVHMPTASDWLWLGVLVVLCTVFAFWMHTWLLRRMSAYTAALALSFEPVYAMVLAALFFGEHKMFSPWFYLGVVIIVLANWCYPVARKRQAMRQSAE